MSMYGADLEQLRHLAGTFRTEAAQVAELRRRITTTLQSTAWTGPAAERFRAEWEANFATALTRLDGALHENARLVDGRLQALTTATH